MNNIYNSIELNLGIKKKLKQNKLKIENKLIAPILIIYYKILNKYNFCLKKRNLLKNIKNGYIPISSEGYSPNATKKWINLENQVSRQSLSIEINLLKEQILTLKKNLPKELCLIDLGTGIGKKGVKFVQLLLDEGFHITKYIAFDGQLLLAESAAKLVKQETNIETDVIVGDLMNIDNINFTQNNCKNYLFLFLGNTIEVDTDPNKIYHVLEAVIKKYKYLILGIRFSKSGQHKNKDIKKLKAFYKIPSMLYPYSDFFTTIPKLFHKYIQISHKWQKDDNCLIRGINIKLPTKIRQALKIPKNHWVKFGQPIYFRTIKQNLLNLKKFNIVSYKTKQNPKNIWDQMALFIISKR
jgi:hypothetical protein